MSRHAHYTDVNVHTPYRQLFANAAARTGDATTYTSSDLHKKALQQDTSQEYYLSSIGPTTWTATAGGGGGGHTIQDEGTPLTARTNLNFTGTGVAVTDDPGNDASLVTINTGGSGDVVGPASAVDDRIATFNTTTGKLIQDGGETIVGLLAVDGSRAMTGGLDMGTNAISNVGLVDGVDVSAHAADTDAHHNEAHTVASHSDTTATGAELETLTDGSDADLLHDHAITDAHVADVTTNPHAVTATQAGADPAGTAASAVSTHAGEADPHTVYQKESEKNAIGGYAGLDEAALLDGAQQVYGTASDTATEGNDSRVPTQGENDALVGTTGTPATGNPYVTNADSRNTDARTPLSHASTHLPGAGDALTTAAPVAVAGPTNAEGADASFARADHEHALELQMSLAGSNVGAHPEINFIQGAGATLGVVDNPGANRVDVTIGSSGSAHTIEDEGTPLAAQPTLNFEGLGVTVTNDAGNNATLVTITSGGGTGDVIGPGVAVDDHIATYNTTTGKLIQDGGEAITDLVAVDGSRAMSGGLDMGTNAISNVGNVDGVDVSAHAADGDAHHAEAHTVASHSDTTATGAELETLTDGSDADPLHVHMGADLHFADTDNPHGITGNEDLITGLIDGGLMTINGGDAALVDVASGNGVVIDWTTGSPVRTDVPFGPFIGESIPDIGAVFTHFYVNAAGAIVKVSGVGPTPTQMKTLIRLQVALHGGATVTNIGTDRGLSAQVTATILDYIGKLGALNEDNRFFANGANLLLAKTSGLTTFPFINATNSIQDAATKVNGEVALLPLIPYSYRDVTPGEFVFDVTPTAIDPDVYDDGSGVLATVPNNQWTVHRLFFFGLTGTWALTVGQDTYANVAAAEASIATENPVLNPALMGRVSVLTTFLIIKKGATDLTDAAEAVFINNTSLNGGAGTGQIAGTWLGLLDTDDVDYVGHAGHVPVVPVGEASLALTALDHDVHLDNVGTNTHAQIDTHIADADAHHNEAHTVASHSDTTATGAELETLTDGSDADLLHDHAITDAHVADVTTNPHAVTATQAGADPAGTAAAAVSAHEGAADPHTVYQEEDEKNVANGYPGLTAGSKLLGAQQVYGTASDTATEGDDARVPTQDQNDALDGTNGTPNAGNAYVTNSDARNTDARTPLTHSHATSDVTGLDDAIGITEYQINGVTDPGEGSLSTGPGAGQVQWTAGSLEYILRGAGGVATRQVATLSASNLTIASIGASARTYVLVQNAGGGATTVIQQTTLPTDAQRRTHYLLGYAKHGLSEISFVVNTPRGRADEGFKDESLARHRGAVLAASDAGVTEEAAFTIGDATGITYTGPGVNYHAGVSDPNVVAQSTAGVTFDVIFASGVTSLDAETAVPAAYESATDTSSAIPAGTAVVHRLIGLPDGSHVLQLGATAYTDYLTAESSFAAELRTSPTWGETDGVVRAYIVVAEGATDWGDFVSKIYLMPARAHAGQTPPAHPYVVGAYRWGIEDNTANGTYWAKQRVRKNNAPVIVQIDLNTGPTTTPLTVDIERNGSTILTAPISMGVGVTTTTSTAFNTTALLDADILSIVIGGSDTGWEGFNMAFEIQQPGRGGV